MSRSGGRKTFRVKPTHTGYQGDPVARDLTIRMRRLLPNATEEVRAHPFLNKLPPPPSTPLIIRCEFCGYVNKRKGQLRIEGNYYACVNPNTCRERQGWCG
jgi:hypothetical protein